MSDVPFTGYSIEDIERDKELLSRSSIPFSCGAYGAPLNEEVDPRPYLKKEYQSSMSSCTAHAITTIMEALAGFQSGDWSSVQQLSRMWAYLQGQRLFGNFGRDSGCSIEAIVRAMSTIGCCLESTFPYPASYSTRMPNAEAEASRFKIGSHAMAESWEQTIEWILNYGGADFGTIWTSRMHNFRGLILDLDTVKEDGSRSGHSYAGVGAIKVKGEYHIITDNSHGDGWGEKSYALMTRRAFEYLLGRSYTAIALLTDLSGVERKPRKLQSFGMG